MDCARILEGVIVGGVGGAVAGSIILLVTWIHTTLLEKRDKDRVWGWITKHASEQEWQFRSTRSIASHTNLTQDRVRYICSMHASIKLSTGEREDMWLVKDAD
jgi:hypothetical protein